MAYKKLFEPGRIGGLTIRNRAVMSPMGTDLADIRGNATPRLIAYYTERAKGGIGLIINEYTGVDDVDSIPTQHNLRMAQDYNVQEAEELTRSVHAYGAKIFAQLHHGGATSKSAFTYTMPSTTAPWVLIILKYSISVPKRPLMRSNRPIASKKRLSRPVFSRMDIQA